ncbi:MAG: DUF2275 domain-containing protein [Deltaproteobacteria bacterium]|nr:DUF2275 domain-containing protein [Deltaproteobacteria bacterium]
MECSEVQKRLSAYIEGTISPEEKVLIDEHLTSCQRCNDALSDLEKTIEYIQELEEIEPPAWLAQKVMARVQSEAESKRGILRRLFYPIPIKLPIEAVAVVLIAVATIYVFKTMQPEMKLVQAPSEEVASQILSQEKEKTLAIEEGKPVPAKPAERFMLAEEETQARKYAGAPKAPAKVAKGGKVEPPAGAVARDELKREVVSKESRARTLAERREEGIGLAVNVRDIETASKEIEEVLMQLGGKIIRTESLENKIVIAAELDSQKVNELLEKLKAIGEVKEKGMALEVWEGEVEIRIELVKTPIHP